MFRIKLRTSKKELLTKFNRVERRLTTKGKWSYFTYQGLYPTVIVAEEEAKRYHETKGVVVTIEPQRFDTS